MNDLQIFSYNGAEVRTIQRDGEPWWVLKDVCKVLELSNSRMVSERLDEDEKGVSIIDTLGGKQELAIINESGLYSVILLSRKPEAKAFKRWITHEVLPTIHKTGSYGLPQLSTNELVLMMAQSNLELEKRIVTVEQKLDTAISKPSGSWKDDMEATIAYIVDVMDLSSLNFKGVLYKELEAKSGARLQVRVKRLAERLKRQGTTYKEQKAITKLDVISQDKKLRLLFEDIVNGQARRSTSENLLKKRP